MNTSPRKTGILLAALGMLLAGNLQAALVNFELTGNVTMAWTPNDFGLDVGDSISVTGSYDNSLLTGMGDEIVSFGSGTGNSMTLVVGNFVYTEADDNNYISNPLFPQLKLSNGLFDGLWFDTGTAFDFFNSGGHIFTGMDSFFGSIDGVWDAGSYTATVIPVPAAVWLLGSGLLGLVAVARRKASA